MTGGGGGEMRRISGVMSKTLGGGGGGVEENNLHHQHSQRRQSDFQNVEGASTKMGIFLEKRAPSKGNLKAKIYNLLDVGIYPYVVITSSGMISISIFSLYII